jgi:hypothetical protein
MGHPISDTGRAGSFSLLLPMSYLQRRWGPVGQVLSAAGAAGAAGATRGGRRAAAEAQPGRRRAGARQGQAEAQAKVMRCMPSGADT